MTSFFNNRAKGHTAFMVLLVLLFAIASGVANACLLEARETHSHAATAGFSEAVQASVILPGHTGAVADGIDESHFKAPCLKACDDGSRSFPNQDSTVAQTDPGPAFVVLVLWNTAPSVIQMPQQMDVEQPATSELPIRVRFSRLGI